MITFVMVCAMLFVFRAHRSLCCLTFDEHTARDVWVMRHKRFRMFFGDHVYFCGGRDANYWGIGRFSDHRIVGSVGGPYGQTISPGAHCGDQRACDWNVGRVDDFIL